MIGMSPINSAPINGVGGGIDGVLHWMGGAGSAEASLEVADPFRARLIFQPSPRPLVFPAFPAQMRGRLSYEVYVVGGGSAVPVQIRSVGTRHRYMSGEGEVEVDQSKAVVGRAQYIDATGSAAATLQSGTIIKMDASEGYFWLFGSGDAAVHLVESGLYLRKTFSGSGVAAPEMNYGPVGWLMSIYAQEPDYRTILVRNDASTTRMRTFRRQPNELLPYDIDFTEWLAPLVVDAFESAQVTVTDAVNGDVSDISVDEVVLMSEDTQGGTIPVARIKVWLSGGVDGAVYKITARCDTTGGRRKEVDFRLNVREV